MKKRVASPNLSLLRNQFDITQVPFSDRGSRLLVYQEPQHSRLFVKLAERLVGLEPGLEAYLRRPPFIRNLCLIDEAGQPLDLQVETNPHVLHFSTRLGDFGLVFQDKHTLAFGLPPHVTAGLRFHVSPQFCRETESGGTLTRTA